jgi:hypothetical protein
MRTTRSVGALRAQSVVTAPGLRTRRRGGALTGGAVVAGRRQDLIDENRGVLRVASDKENKTGTRRRDRSTVTGWRRFRWLRSDGGELLRWLSTERLGSCS